MTRRSALLSFSLVLLIASVLACSFVQTPTAIPSTATATAPPSPTPEPPTPTPMPTSPPPSTTPKPARIQFEPGATSTEVTGHVEEGGSRLHVLRALAGQTMEVQVTSANNIQLEIRGADGTVLKEPADGEPSWRGKLPSAQDYFISVVSVGEETPYTLTAAIGPLGWENYRDETYGFEMWYPEDFVVDMTCRPVAVRGNMALGLRLTGSEYYSDTNLLNACVIVGVDQDEEASSTCLEPKSPLEEPLGEKEINGTKFQKWSSQEGAAGNIFEEISYRAIHRDACCEIALLMHSGNIGAYSEGTVTEFDREAVLDRLEQVLHTFRLLE